jgi:hypothetical protein
MTGGQGFFWSIAGPISVVLISVTYIVAFSGRVEGGFFRFRG